MYELLESVRKSSVDSGNNKKGVDMKLTNIFLVAVFSVGALLLLARTFYRSKKVVTVGVLLSDGMYYHQKTYQGFIDRCRESTSSVLYDIKPFYFHGLDKINMSSVAQSLLDSKPDIVVSLGSMGSLVLAELMRKRQCKTPHVFTGVTNSVDLGLVQSLERPGDNITGVMTGGYKQLTMPHILRLAKPDVQRVLIPYDMSDDPDGFSSKTASAIADYLSQYGIKSTIAPIAGLSEAMKIITNLIEGHDVVMGLEVDSFVALSSGLVKLCNEKKALYFAASVEGADEGAVFSFGSQPLFVGAGGFDQVQKIIEEGQLSATLPVMSLNTSRQFIINTRYAAEQGVADIDTDAICARIAKDEEIGSFSPLVKVIK